MGVGLNKQLWHVCNCPLSHNQTVDFTVLNNILAYETASLETLRIHLTCMLVSMVTVMSSIKPLLDGRLISVFALVPLDSPFAALIIMFNNGEQFDNYDAYLWQNHFEAGCCEFVVWEPQMDAIEVIHKEVTCSMMWYVVLVQSH